MGKQSPIRAFRESHEPTMPQQVLAEKIGVHRVTLTAWENGRPIGLDKLPLVAKVTRIPEWELRPDLAARFRG